MVTVPSASQSRCFLLVLPSRSLNLLAVTLYYSISYFFFSLSCLTLWYLLMHLQLTNGIKELSTFLYFTHLFLFSPFLPSSLFLSSFSLYFITRPSTILITVILSYLLDMPPLFYYFFLRYQFLSPVSHISSPVYLPPPPFLLPCPLSSVLELPC